MRVFLVLLLVLPGAAAQWSDPAGDHEIGVTPGYVEGEPQMVWLPPPEGEFREGDVRSVSWTETEETFTLHVEVEALRDTADTLVLEHIVSFEHRGSRYGIVLRQSDFGDDAAWGPYAVGYLGDPMVGWTLAVPMHVAGNVLSATFEKRYMLDADRIPLRLGDELTDVRLEMDRTGNQFVPCPDLQVQIGFSVYACNWNYRDPVALQPIQVAKAPAHQGHLFLDSLQPLRLSNGLATTYVFNVTLHNVDGPADTVELSAEDVPAGWDVLLPRRVAVTDSVRVPVAVGVPFQHLHGSTQTFRIVGESTAEPGVATDLELGVRWTEVPQPTRHHPELFLHNGAFWFGTMDTVAGEDEPAMGGAQSNSCCDPGPRPYTHGQQWEYRLSGLGVGLQFVEGDITGSVEIDADRAFEGEAWAELVLEAETDTVVASMEPVPIDWQQGVQTLELGLQVLEQRIEYAPRQDLVLSLHIEGFTLPVGPNTPFPGFHVQPGASIVLPLGEYHELDRSLDVGGFRLTGPEAAPANAGETMVWHLEAAAGGASEVAFDVLSPIPATIAPATAAVRDGLEVVVRIDVPHDAQVGQRFPVMAAMFAEQGIAVASMEVYVTDDDVPDAAAEAEQAQLEAEQAARGKDSPGTLWGVAALAGLAALRRRG